MSEDRRCPVCGKPCWYAPNAPKDSAKYACVDIECVNAHGLVDFGKPRMIKPWTFNRRLPEFFPYHVDLPNNIQVATVVGWILAEGTSFAVTPNLWSKTYRLWMSNSSYKVVQRRMSKEEKR